MSGNIFLSFKILLHSQKITPFPPGPSPLEPGWPGVPPPPRPQFAAPPLPRLPTAWPCTHTCLPCPSPTATGAAHQTIYNAHNFLLAGSAQRAALLLLLQHCRGGRHGRGSPLLQHPSHHHRHAGLLHSAHRGNKSSGLQDGANGGNKLLS